MNHKLILLVIVVAMIALALLAGCSNPGSNKNNAGSADNVGKNELADDAGDSDALSPLVVTILKVGKADAIICETDGHAMVIDAGEDDDGEEVVNFLKSRGISSLDALVITHFDKDHVGGADTLIDEIPADRVLLPDYVGTHPEYEEFMDSLSDAKVTPEMVVERQTFELGGAEVTIDPPSSYEIPDSDDEYDNNFSLITTIVHGSKKLFFAGDIEKERIRELVENDQLEDVDFLKVPHHGVYEAELEELFSITSPEYAVICSSKKNPADSKTLELLEKYGINYTETRHGDVTITSDGQKLSFYQDTD